jgi:lipid-A-disaccharide synthase
LAETSLRLLEDKELIADIQEEFKRMHISLKQNTEEKAAEAILSYL